MIDESLVNIFLKEYYNVRGEPIDEEDIKCGWCYQFALCVYYVYGGELRSDCDHAWVNIDGLNFDSDNIEGTTRYLGWDCVCADCRSLGNGYETVDEDEFVSFWDRNGASGPVDFEVIGAVVDTYKENAA